MTQGTNLITPFRRDLKQDLAHGSGAAQLRAKVEQVLATEGDTPLSSGELPWRTAFGSAIHLLRHRANNEALAELARVYVRDTLRRWLPALQIVTVETYQHESTLVLRITFTERESDVPQTVEVER